MKDKNPKLQKELPLNDSGCGPSPSNSQRNSSFQQDTVSLGTGPSSSKESSVTPTLKQTPTKRISPVSSNRLKLKRRKLMPNIISKEPSLKLLRVDAEDFKKAKPDQQESTKDKCGDSNTDGDATINSSCKRYVLCMWPSLRKPGLHTQNVTILLLKHDILIILTPCMQH